jgi:hypothetical protein
LKGNNVASVFKEENSIHFVNPWAEAKRLGEVTYDVHLRINLRRAIGDLRLMKISSKDGEHGYICVSRLSTMQMMLKKWGKEHPKEELKTLTFSYKGAVYTMQINANGAEGVKVDG